MGFCLSFYTELIRVRMSQHSFHARLNDRMFGQMIEKLSDLVIFLALLILLLYVRLGLVDGVWFHPFYTTSSYIPLVLYLYNVIVEK